ncbi:MAG: glycosyl hydrolase family 28 protein [Verrucomicrobia bacterium]|nr:glycosyl hydrolase family 28 protein [Verrucomicrobiota bacterium]
MTPYTHPKSLPHSREFSLRINGQSVEVLHTDVADFAIAALAPEDFPATLEVTPSLPPAAATVHPLSKNIAASIADGAVHFTLDRPEKLSVAIPGLKALYVFAQAPETNPPDANDPSVVTFPAGQITETPLLTLEDGQTLYLPGGAVLKGRIHVQGKSGIRICGHGIFDGSFYDRAAGQSPPSIILERCPGVLVEDITMVRPQGWMLVLAACQGATVRNLKEIGEVVSSDGIDVVGSFDVLIEDCFLHNNDDCVVVKAFDLTNKLLPGVPLDCRENVENVLVQHCTLANWHAGNAMEIGHELSVDHVCGVTFRNIDVLHTHGSGAVFSIHNNDRALIENVVFENIRIEHCYDKLIDFRISLSRYSTDKERGRIRNVTLRNIEWNRTPFNLGYTISLIGGWDADHTIEDIHIENFRIDGLPVRHPDELEICSRHCHGLRLLG